MKHLINSSLIKAGLVFLILILVTVGCPSIGNEHLQGQLTIKIKNGGLTTSFQNDQLVSIEIGKAYLSLEHILLEPAESDGGGHSHSLFFNTGDTHGEEDHAEVELSSAIDLLDDGTGSIAGIGDVEATEYVHLDLEAAPSSMSTANIGLYPELLSHTLYIDGTFGGVAEQIIIDAEIAFTEVEADIDVHANENTELLIELMLDKCFDGITSNFADATDEIIASLLANIQIP